jgi:hypothetical protein
MYRRNSGVSIEAIGERLRTTVAPATMRELSADQMKTVVGGLKPIGGFGGTTTCCYGCADDCDKASTILT